MQDIIDANLPIKIREASYKELKEIFQDNPYKWEMIEELEKIKQNPRFVK